MCTSCARVGAATQTGSLSSPPLLHSFLGASLRRRSSWRCFFLSPVPPLASLLSTVTPSSRWTDGRTPSLGPGVQALDGDRCSLLGWTGSERMWPHWGSTSRHNSSEVLGGGRGEMDSLLPSLLSFIRFTGGRRVHGQNLCAHMGFFFFFAAGADIMNHLQESRSISLESVCVSVCVCQALCGST